MSGAQPSTKALKDMKPAELLQQRCVGRSEKTPPSGLKLPLPSPVQSAKEPWAQIGLTSNLRTHTPT